MKKNNQKTTALKMQRAVELKIQLMSEYQERIRKAREDAIDRATEAYQRMALNAISILN